MTLAKLTELADAIEHARTARDHAIYQAHQQGHRQKDIAEAAGLTREQIRRIVRAQER